VAPLQRLIETCCQPPAAALDRVWEWACAARAEIAGVVGRGVRWLPMPHVLRRSLWLEAPKLHDDGIDHAHRVLKRQYAVMLPVFLVVAVAGHAGLFLLSPSIRVPDLSMSSDELVAIRIEPEIEVEVPPPPNAIRRPATPIMAATAVDDDLSIAPTTFDSFVRDAPTLPPPPDEEEAEEELESFAPLTVAPAILNAEELHRIMREEYPRPLRDAGIGGRVRIEAYVDAHGRVERVRIAAGSGYQSLDAAALRVARRMKCSPALQRDRTVGAWLSTSLEFQVR
jgi:TonB family protein